jgi:hypothetical protein
MLLIYSPLYYFLSYNALPGASHRQVRLTQHLYTEECDLLSITSHAEQRGQSRTNQKSSISNYLKSSQIFAILRKGPSELI